MELISTFFCSEKITGSLVCEDTCSRNGLEEIGQTLIITVNDVSLADAASIQIARKEVSLLEKWSFPLSYEIEFDESEILQNKWKTFSISARIINIDGNLSFITDTRNSLTSIDGGLKSEIDMNIVRINSD